MRHLTTGFELSSAEAREILDLTRELKDGTRRGERKPLLQGHVLVQIFEKPSLRTRLSFEAAMMQLGGSSIFLPAKEAGLDGRETPEDVARVVGGYADIIALRTFSQGLVETFTKYSGKPVINGLSDDFHPCQALADVITAEETFGSVQGRTLAYVGDGNNVARSLALVCAQVGMRFTIGAPKGFELDLPFLKRLGAVHPNARIDQFSSPVDAVRQADIVYTDVWASMGQEAEKETRAKAFQGFQVNAALMKHARSEAIFMHCLPARRGLEVTNDIMESPQSVVFPQAENRMHLAKGLIVWLLRQQSIGR